MGEQILQTGHLQPPLKAPLCSSSREALMVAQRLRPYLILPGRLSSTTASRELSELLEVPLYLCPCNYKPQNERKELVSSFLKKKAITSSPTGR